MNFYSKTDIGKVRISNQDAVNTRSINENLAWSLVCDGMGGSKGGDIASTMAVEEISNYINENLNEQFDFKNVKELMYNAIQDANLKIFQKASSSKSLKNMGTTVVLCIIKDDVLHIMYAGDSRVYLISDKKIRQVSTDHSIVQEMVDHGEITIQDAKNHPQKHIITRALGVIKDIKLDYIKVDLNKEDIVLMCTDGLTNELDDKEICKICLENSISLVPEKLIKKANKHGGNDNITVSAVKI